MRELVKWVIIHGRRGTFRHRALIDTGTEMVVMPRRIALQAGTSWSGERADVGLSGAVFEAEIHKADIEIVGSGCRATVEVLVPSEEENRRPEFMIGSLFLQKTKAVIAYVGDHPVLSFPNKRHILRAGGARLIPGQGTLMKASSSAAAKKRRSSTKKAK
jgi:predicted aspartyl protease